MGEVFADFSAHAVTLPTATAFGGMGLIIALALQFSVRRYVPWIYWLTVVMVSIFGTLFADILKDELGVSLAESTVGFVIGPDCCFCGLVCNREESVRTPYSHLSARSFLLVDCTCHIRTGHCGGRFYRSHFTLGGFSYLEYCLPS